jgi:hypothetical protein
MMKNGDQDATDNYFHLKGFVHLRDTMYMNIQPTEEKCPGGIGGD